MPSKTAKQARTMRACAHDAPLKVCKHIPKSVAQEFVAADAGKKHNPMKHGYHKVG